MARPRLEAFLRYQGFDQHTRQDLSADVVERVITRIATLRAARAFESWFWTIVRNVVRSHLRRDQRQQWEPMSATAASPEEIAILHEEHRAVRRALRELSEKDRTLLWLREVEGLGYRSISDQFESSPATVRVQCHRARIRLEAAYEAAQASSPAPRSWRAAFAEE